MRRLTNVNPASLVESVERLTADGTRAAVVGGGTDLLGMIKDDLVPTEVLVNLKGLTERGNLQWLTRCKCSTNMTTCCRQRFMSHRHA